MAHPPFNLPHLGYGLGLREPHYEAVATQPISVDWFEVLSENFMEAHPGYWELLTDIRARYPLVMHGVAMNIAGTDPMNRDYLEKLKKLATHVGPVCISDHLCWTSAQGINSHDLLPVPYTQEALMHVVDRVKTVQDTLGCPLVLENPSTYTEFQESSMPEWEFMAQLAQKAGCGILLDVNNVYVSAFNHRYDAKTYINAMPAESIAYVHLAGHRNMGTHIVDTHDDYVIDAVWELYRYTVSKLGAVSTMIEWDGNIPELSVLLMELDKARVIATQSARKVA